MPPPAGPSDPYPSQTPPVYQPAPGYPGYAPYPGYPGYASAPQPPTRSWLAPTLLGSLAALIVGLLIGGAIGYGVGRDGGSGAAGVAASTSIAPRGDGVPSVRPRPPGATIPPWVAINMPAGLLTSITGCSSASGLVYYTKGGPAAPGVSCRMELDGMPGEMAAVDGRANRAWLDEAFATREQRPGYRPIPARGWTGYQFDWDLGGGTTIPCTVVIDPQKGFYFDFVSRGTPEQAVPFAEAVQRKLNPDVS